MGNTSALGLPYSTFRKAGDYYYISGQVGVDLATKTASPDVRKQTIQLFKNLQSVLEQASLTYDDIVKTTIFVTDMGDFATINELYASHFNDPRPARSTVAVAELPRITDTPLKIEIEAVAYKPAA